MHPPEALPRGYDYHVSAEIREMRKALHLGDDGSLTPNFRSLPGWKLQTFKTQI